MPDPDFAPRPEATPTMLRAADELDALRAEYIRNGYCVGTDDPECRCGRHDKKRRP